MDFARISLVAVATAAVAVWPIVPPAAATHGAVVAKACQSGYICFSKPDGEQLAQHAADRCSALEQAPWVLSRNNSGESQKLFSGDGCRGRSHVLRPGAATTVLGKWRSFAHG